MRARGHIQSFYMRLGWILLVGVLLVATAFLNTPKEESYPELEELVGYHDRSFTELSDYFRTLTEVKGATYAFAVLAQAPLPPDTDPHLLGHIIGDVLYAQKGISGIALCTDAFRNACSHSVVIGILSEHGEAALPEVSLTCRQAPGGSGAYTMCYHGVGHGVLAYVGYDLEKAVVMCKNTGTEEYGYREYVECVGGSIMEMIAGVHDRLAWERHVGKYFKEDDPLYPCDASFMPEEVREICYIYLTPHLFSAAGVNLEGAHEYGDAFSLCSSLSNSTTRDACFGGFGKEFVSLARGRDIRDVGTMGEEELRNVRLWCTQASDAQAEASCNSHALSSLFWGGESKPDAAFLFCAIEEGDTQHTCYQELGEKIDYYLRGTVRGQSLCRQLPEEFHKLCVL